MSKSGPEVDFFISRRGGDAAVAQEVADILMEEGYAVLVQDYDISYTTDFVAAMDDALRRCRHLSLFLTKDYLTSEFTMMEVTNFVAAAGRAADEHRLVILRLDKSMPEGIMASRLVGDLFEIVNTEGRNRRNPRRGRGALNGNAATGQAIRKRRAARSKLHWPRRDYSRNSWPVDEPH